MVHTPVTGYRELSAEEIALINECKATAIEVGKLCDRVRLTKGIDQRWAATGITDLQKGFMSLIRSIAQPTTF